MPNRGGHFFFPHPSRYEMKSFGMAREIPDPTVKLIETNSHRTSTWRKVARGFSVVAREKRPVFVGEI